MKINKYIFYLYRYLVKSKKEFIKPKQCSILIYDRSGVELFFNYFNQKDVEILNVRAETLNLYIFMKVIFSGKFTFEKYLNEYVKYVNPKVVITFIDNNFLFYKQKSANPNIKFIIIQNGIRDAKYLSEMISKSNRLQNFKVDYFFSNTKNIGNIYKKALNCDVITIGSFKNNLVTRDNIIINENKLIFLSQYREPKDISLPIYTFDDGSEIFFNDFYMAENKLLPMLEYFCNLYNIELVIAGVSAIENGKEFEFYDKILKNSEWKFLPKRDVFSNYSEIDNARYVVGVDSTLCFEALGIEKRVAVFACRKQFVPNRDFSFGEYCNLGDKGEFWSDDINQEEFDRVMNFVVHSNDKNWKDIIKEYKNNIMAYDKGNMKFVSLMKELDIPLKASKDKNDE